jgi:predicted O-methyltransferase YrrM
LTIKKYIVAKKAFSLKYFFYRLSRPILKINYWLYTRSHPNRPWLSPESIKYLEERLTKDMIGLEYGSGRSTVFFANKLKKLISIEHHTEWYEKVAKLITKNELDNVEYLLIPEQHTDDENEDIELETRLLKFDGTEARDEFNNYSSKVNEYPDEYFDFVLIDGRARVKCGLNAITKLKKDGIFVLDNSERPRYLPLHTALESWPRVETTTGLTNTTIWIKP